MNTLLAELQEYIVLYNAGSISDIAFIANYETLLLQMLNLIQAQISIGEDFVSARGADYWELLGVSLTPSQVNSMLEGDLSNTIATADASTDPLATTSSRHFLNDMWGATPISSVFRPSWMPDRDEEVVATPEPTVNGVTGPFSAEYVANNTGVVENTIPTSWHINSTATPDTSNVTSIAGGSYTVTPGDTLGAIAAYFGVSIESIREANGISNINLIYPGTVLRIPGGGISASSSSVSGGTTIIAPNTSTGTPTVESEATTPIASATFATPESVSWAGIDITTPSIRYNNTAPIHKTSSPSQYSAWAGDIFELPGYSRAVMKLMQPISTASPKGAQHTFEFFIGPQGISETHSNDVQQVKTGGGWMLYQTGPGLAQLSLQGYFLDSKFIDERRTFLDAYYSKFLINKRKAFGDYFNNNRLSIEVEGMIYEGILINLSLSKSAQQMFTYAYQMSFICVSQKIQGALRSALSSFKKPKSSAAARALSVSSRSLPISRGTHAVLTSRTPTRVTSSLSSTRYDINNVRTLLG